VVEEKNRFLLAWQSLGELDRRTLANAGFACDKVLRGLYGLYQVDDGLDHGDLSRLEYAINAVEPGSWPGNADSLAPFPFSAAYGNGDVSRALARVMWLPNDDLRRRLFSLLESSNADDREWVASVLDGDLSQEIHVFETLRRLAETDESPSVRREAVDALARSFAKSPETFEIIRKRLEEDDSEYVRELAVFSIVKFSATRPETSELLWMRVLVDDGHHVRGYAINELAYRFTERSETFDRLRKSVVAYDSPVVRYTAVYGLAENFADRPDTYAMVLIRAVCDESESVRDTAVEALGDFWGERPSTLEVLLDRARKDDSGKVRRTATDYALRIIDRSDITDA
jgi:hypothetical protein